jgi:structural hemagglutinin/hemolysin toxin protein RtxA
MTKMNMYIINFYVPETHLEQVKLAMFGAGAGQIGNYSSCAWQVQGAGQFKPLEGSNAFIGKINQLEEVVEYKVEIVCKEENIAAAISALKHSHPYETMAYYITKSEAW